MFKNIKYLIIFILIMSTFFTLIYPNIVITSIIESLNIFIYKLFPSIFFLYTIIDLLINYNIIKYINIIFNKLFKYLFHIDHTSTIIILISMISGFPSGSKYISEFLEQKLIKKDTAEYLLTFTHFSNPIFILGIISSIYNKHIGIIVLIIHYISNFILAFIIRPKTFNLENNINKHMELPIDKALKKSFTNTFNVLMIILGNTIFFYTLSSIITYYINNSLISTLINGIFDLTKGIIMIKNLSITNFFKLLLIISFITFGGISVNFQVKEIIAKEKLDYKYFLFGRISSLAISIILLIGCYTIGII